MGGTNHTALVCPPCPQPPGLKKEPQTESPLRPLLSTMQNSGEWIFGKNTDSHFVFLCHCWFSILSSRYTPKKLWKSCVLLEAFRRILSLMTASCHESSFSCLSWACSSSARALPEGLAVESGFADYHPPQRPEAQPWSSFARGVCQTCFSLTLLLAMSGQRLGAFVS